MAVYNTIHFKNSKDEEIFIQSKNGDPCMNNYNVGDLIDLSNGIYFGHEGSFVVYQGRIVAAFDSEEQHLYDKWDRLLEYPDLQSVNPITQMMNKLKSELQ